MDFFEVGDLLNFLWAGGFFDFFWVGEFFLGRGIFFLVRIKLGYPPNFKFLGKPLLGEKYVEGKKKIEKNIVKFSGH